MHRDILVIVHYHPGVTDGVGIDANRRRRKNRERLR